MLKKFVAAIVLSGAAGPLAAAPAQDRCAGGALTLPRAAFQADARGLANGLPTEQARQILARYGITVTWTPPESPLLIIDYAMDYGGQRARRPGFAPLRIAQHSQTGQWKSRQLHLHFRAPRVELPVSAGAAARRPDRRDQSALDRRRARGGRRPPRQGQRR